jgi:hypothetical protein
MIATIAVLAVAVGLGGCKDRDKQKETPKTGSGSGTGTGAGPTAPDPTTPDPTTPDPTAPGPTPGPPTGIPECEAYRAAVDKLMACDKVEKSARDATRAAFEKAAKQWATPDGKTGAAATCLAAIEGMKQSFASIGCEL